jgi:hypothetical protein
MNREEIVKTLNTISRLIVLIAFVAMLATFRTHRVSATNPQPLPPGEFGMVGLVSGQTARLNVVMPNGPPTEPSTSQSSRASTRSDVSGSSVNVNLTFFDANGDQFIGSDGQPVQSTVTLTPGHSTFLDFNANAMPTGPSWTANTPGGRGQIRAQVIGDWSGPGDEKHTNPIISTLEVFDNSTGKTTVLMPVGPPTFPVGPPN